MATTQFTSADRDAQGFVKAAEPRSLADLLPPIAPAADPTIRRQPLTRAEQATMILFAVLLFGLLAYLWSGQKVTSAPLPQATAHIAPTVPPATPAAPTPPPVAMLPVFGSPDGTPFNQIEATRPMTVTGHYNQDWVQAEVQGSGRIWLRVSDAPQLALAGPNLAPVIAAPLIDPAPSLSPEDLTALNDPAQNGNNLAPPGCPFPIINGICGNGVRAKDVPDVPARKSVKGV